MKTTHETNVRVKGNRDRSGPSGLVLAALLAFGFAMPAHGATSSTLSEIGAGVRRASEANYEMGVTLATIRVPVKLHNLPDSFFLVKCRAYDRLRGSLRKRGDSLTTYRKIPASGEISTTVAVIVHPLKNISNPSRLITWQCELHINSRTNTGGYQGARLSAIAERGARFKGNVSGSF